jgi:hypothetical protein
VLCNTLRYEEGKSSNSVGSSSRKQAAIGNEISKSSCGGHDNCQVLSS